MNGLTIKKKCTKIFDKPVKVQKFCCSVTRKHLGMQESDKVKKKHDDECA